MSDRRAAALNWSDQDSWTDRQIAEHVARPIAWHRRRVVLAKFVIGLENKHGRIHFPHRQYHDRTAEARADYARLASSIGDHGLRCPLICCWVPGLQPRLHVLVGMRCAEISISLGIDEAEAMIVAEDVRRWWRHDVPRLDRLKRSRDEIDYQSPGDMT